MPSERGFHDTERQRYRSASVGVKREIVAPGLARGNPGNETDRAANAADSRLKGASP